MSVTIVQVLKKEQDHFEGTPLMRYDLKIVDSSTAGRIGEVITRYFAKDPLMKEGEVFNLEDAVLKEYKREIFDTRALQEECKAQIREEVTKETETLGIKPILTIVQVGDDYASCKYINQKILHGESVGMEVRHIKLHDTITTDELIQLIQHTQRDTDGIIVQLPLPKQINERAVLDSIDASKDVDCLTTINTGKLHSGKAYLKPCTPSGVIKILDKITDLEGKNALIVGRSHIVGRPLAEMLTQRNCTVTLAHSKTKDLDHLLLSGQYDIIVAAIGKPKALIANADILLDVGINFDENNKMCGDFDLDKCNFNYATPVPNGVGRMTIIGLLENVLAAAKTD